MFLMNMNSLYTIETKSGRKYERRAWTGGDKPDIDFEYDPIANDLIQAFIDEQISECPLDFWVCIGISEQERLAQYKRRAVLDAWRTLQSASNFRAK